MDFKRGLDAHDCVIVPFIIVISVDVSMKTCGAKEGSGYTHSYNDEPITFVPGNPHKNDRPVSRISIHTDNLSQFMRFCYSSHMRAAKA